MSAARNELLNWIDCGLVVWCDPLGFSCAAAVTFLTGLNCCDTDASFERHNVINQASDHPHTLYIPTVRRSSAVAMQPPHSDPAHPPVSDDEAEAFIGQEGADGFDGEVIDDLDGEGAARTRATWR